MLLALRRCNMPMETFDSRTAMVPPKMPPRTAAQPGLTTTVDPRQGLRRLTASLLAQLHNRLDLGRATISLQGPQPRVFRHAVDGALYELEGAEALRWNAWLSALPHDAPCLRIASAEGARCYALDALSGARRGSLDKAASDALGQLCASQSAGLQALTIPFTSYGQPLGCLCLQRCGRPFHADDLFWVYSVIRHSIPLLERSDLLEQLQRESAAHERERIGRDLHDSAIQPYLGLKYGLEALARQAGTEHPLSPQIAELVQMTIDELATLRDLIGGLRSGSGSAVGDATPLAALERQAKRFEALYGLKVSIRAPDAPRLRAAAAQSLLHMVNEALTNVRRHTGASMVRLQLSATEDGLLLSVGNDRSQADGVPQDFVPRSLSQRAAAMGGSLRLCQRRDWTEVLISLPLLGTLG
jgi:signal transduction histidine kinase